MTTTTTALRRLRDALNHEGYALTARALPSRWVLIYRMPSTVERHEVATWIEGRAA